MPSTLREKALLYTKLCDFCKKCCFWAWRMGFREIISPKLPRLLDFLPVESYPSATQLLVRVPHVAALAILGQAPSR